MGEDKVEGKIKNIVFEVLKNEKYKKIVIFAGLIGIVLIFCSSFFKTDNKTEQELDSDLLTTEQYTERLEKNLKEIISSIKGAGECKVLVTVENGKEIVYATQAKKNTEATEDKSNGETTRKQESDDSETKYITIKDSNGTEKALAITEIQPTVKGVVVVCAGGDNPVVQQSITNAVTTALNITSKRVCVTKLS